MNGQSAALLSNARRQIGDEALFRIRYHKTAKAHVELMNKNRLAQRRRPIEKISTIIRLSESHQIMKTQRRNRCMSVARESGAPRGTKGVRHQSPKPDEGRAKWSEVGAKIIRRKHIFRLSTFNTLEGVWHLAAVSTVVNVSTDEKIPMWRKLKPYAPWRKQKTPSHLGEDFPNRNNKLVLQHLMWRRRSKPLEIYGFRKRPPMDRWLDSVSLRV